MEDIDIIALYFKRDERAIEETQSKYKNYLFTIAVRVLGDFQEALAIVNETYWKLWQLIPPNEPLSLKAYAAKITRAKAIDKYREARSKKRGSGEYTYVLDELSDLIANDDNPLDDVLEDALAEEINVFLYQEEKQNRRIFLLRYFSFYSIAEISREEDISESNVKTRLYRMRKELSQFLEQRGYKL